MIAGVVLENEKVKATEVPMPEITEDDCLVKVYATGICGSDIPRVWKNGAHNYPIILGHEFSGVVEKVGANVSEFKPNDHVVGIPLIPCFECEDCKNGNYSLCKNYSFIGSRRDGSMSEYISIPKTNLLKIDDDIDLLHAAFFEPSTVALHAINLVNLNKDSNVLVLGGGNIGSFMIQWLKILGVKNITVIGRNKDKLKNCLKYGATNTVSSLDSDYEEQLSKLTNNRGFDYVFETAGSTDLMHLALKEVANKGTVCMVGTPTKEMTFTVKEWEQINRKELFLTGSWMSYSNPWPGVEWQETLNKLRSKELVIYDELIYQTYPLKDIDKAFDLYKDDKKPNGKVLILTK